MVSALLVSGCDGADDEQKKADEAAEEAREKGEKVQASARESTRRIEGEATEKIAEAQAAFSKMREDHRHEIESNLVKLDEEITKLSARAQTEGAKAKLATETKLAEIRVKREHFQSSVRTLGTTSAREWDALRAALDQEWDDLKKFVDKAS